MTQSTTCGSANGGATASAAGGNGPYSWLWSDGTTTQTISGILAGTYAVTATDASGCTASAAVTIINLSGPAASVTQTDVSCLGLADGQAVVTANGGVPPYLYNWSTGATTMNVAGLDTGTYSVTVTDNSGCSTIVNFTILQPSQLQAAASAQSALCNGENSGHSTVSANGGTLPYSYLWSNGAIMDTAYFLYAGSYTVTVTDAHGCSTTTTSVVSEPAVISVNTSATNAFCFGSSDGTLQAWAAGGTAPYSWSWSNGATLSSPLSVPAGNYTVTVTDGNGCSQTATAVVSQPTAILLNFQTVSSTCGASNGSARVTANGGSPGYTYLWSTGFSTDSISGIPAATYTVTVSDQSGCSASQSVVVQDLSGPSLSISNITNPSCYGASDGAATTTQTGGSPPYSYSWSNGTTTSVNSGLSAGSYTVTVTDNNGCQSSVSVQILQPAILSTSIVSNAATCHGAADGTATVTGAGGTLPYNYIWSNGNTSSVAINLAAAVYIVTLTDSHGCSTMDSVTITEPGALTLQTTATDALCFGSATGSALVSVTGGIPPYQYSWSSGQSVASASGLQAGTHTVTITDANGCTSSAGATVSEPPPVLIQPVVVPVSCFGGTNGSITLTVTGGTGNYTYLWSTGSGNGASAQSLVAGNYTVTVTDANACSTSLVMQVSSPSILATNPSVIHITCKGADDGAAAVNPTGGVSPYNYNWSTGAAGVSSISGLTPGLYTVTVTDQNGCTSQSGIQVNEPAQLLLNATGATTLCIGQTATLTATATGGTGGYSFYWSNGNTNQVQQVAPSVTTDYTVSVTDANNCTTTKKVVTITVYPALSVTTSADTALCTGESATLSAQGGGGNGGPYTYTWSNQAGHSAVVNVSPAVTTTYLVTVSDNCGTPVALDSVIVVVNPLPLVNFAIDPSEGCIPLNVTFTNQTITSLQSHVFWNFGDGFTDTIQNPVHIYTVAGVYDVSLEVTSSEGCVSSIIKRNAISTFGIPEASFIADPNRASILHPLISFEDKSAGSINWDWDFGDGTGTSILQNPKYYYKDTGTYIVRLIVENDHACQDTVYEQVIIEPDFTLYIPNAFTPNDDGRNEFFRVSGIGITSMQLIIFDRWGNRVFSSENMEDGWNGRVNNSGAVCQQDTYVYLVKVVTFHGEHKEITGRVTIIR